MSSNSTNDTAISSANQKVLLVEDNNINRKVIGLLLKKMNYFVIEAVDGYEAIELAKQNDFTLILMDIVMPGIDGYETTSIIRSLEGANKLVPIVALTANDVNEIEDKVINSGMNGALEKPLNKVTLENLISKIFNQTSHNNRYIFNQSQFELEYEDKDLRKDIIQTFIEDKDKDLQRIKASFESKDITVIYATLHYLKGSFTYLKADKILNATMTIMKKCNKKLLTEVLSLEEPLTECYKHLVVVLTDYYNTI